MARAISYLFCVPASVGAPPFAPSTISTHFDTALALVTFLRARRYGIAPLRVRTFAHAAFADNFAPPRASGQKPIRPAAQALQQSSFRVGNQIAFATPKTASTQGR